MIAQDRFSQKASRFVVHDILDERYTNKRIRRFINYLTRETSSRVFRLDL